MNELKTNVAQLREKKVELTEERKAEIELLKKNYQDLFALLNDDSNLKMVNKKISKRLAKRNRFKRKKADENRLNILKEKEIEQKHAQIDEAMRKMQEKLKAEKEVFMFNSH